MASEPLKISDPLRFGENFELDLRAYELRRAGRAVKLERIPMDLLVLLLERRGQLVSREEIVERIWGKDVFLDTDNSINAAIRKIRQVLKDDPERPRYVQTVTGRGYRFIAGVTEASRAVVVEPSPAPPTPAGENLLGKKVSHYRVLQMLGGGGMGVVYKAEDLKLGRLVALKFLPSEVGSDPIAFERLQREARAASSLDHPNICSIYQLGDHDGQPFIVMQLLEGQTLRDWIERAASLEPGTRLHELLNLGVQITEGLQAAHEKGIIHRDIKPANIFITSRGVAKILDFGVAKFVDATEAAEAKGPAESGGNGKPVAVDPRLTHTGASVGTPSYLSPEQIRRDRLDARTDLFSLGLVLYEMATGQRAFSGSTATVIRDAVLNFPAVPARSLNSDLPPEVDRIIGKCLEKSPAQRYQSAEELRQDLARVETGLPAATSRAWSKRIWAWGLGGVALVLLILFGVNIGRIRERLGRSPSASESIPAKYRPAVAVLGFKNLSTRDDEAWISTALSEMFGAELAAGQQLRVIPGENVARMKLDLSLPAAESYGGDTLQKIRNDLGTDLVVLGSYFAAGKDAGGKIRVDLQLQDARAGDTVAVFSEDGTEVDLADLVSRGGSGLRQRLGIGEVSASDFGQVRSAVPSNPEAARLYSEGLLKLRSFDALAARDLLTRAIALDPNHALSYAALSESWSTLGYDVKAQEDAKKAVDLSAKLPREEQLWVEGRYREAGHEWQRAVEIYRMLWGFFPDNLEYGLRLARVQTSAGTPKDAMTTIETMAKWPLPAGGDPRIDLAEAAAADKLGDLHREEAATVRAADKGRKQGARSITARALQSGGSVLIALGDNTQAEAWLKEAQTIFAEVGDQQGVARALCNLGIIERRRSNLAEALKFEQQSLDISREHGNTLGMLEAVNNLGNVYWDQGDTARSLDAQLQSLQLAREIGDKTNQSSTLNNLGGLYTQQGKLQKGREMYDESLRLSREVGDDDGAGMTMGNVADLLTRLGDLPAARKTAEEALALDRRAGDKTFEAYALYQLGAVLVLQADIAGGRSRHQEAAALRHGLGEKVTEGESQLSLAQLQLDTGDAKGAESEARRLAQVFHSGSATDDEALCYSLMALALVAQNRFAEAQQAAAKADEVLPKALDLATRLQVDIGNAYVAGMANALASPAQRNARSIEAVAAKLKGAGDQASRLGYVELAMEARLRQGELDVQFGRLNEGRARLQQLEKDAKAGGFLLLAQKAAADLGRAPEHGG